MAVQKGRARRNKRDDAEDGQRRYIGWDLTAEEQDDIRFRVKIFVFLGAVVVCVGFWFLLSRLNEGAERPVLRAPAAGGATRTAYTVRLLDFATAQRDVAERLRASQSLQALAGEHGFRFHPVGNGRVALCVGAFGAESDPGLQRLLRDFQEFTDDGRKPFQNATIHPFSY